MLPPSNNCTNCHTPVDAAAVVRVPAGQLDLADGLSPDEPDQFNSYRELLFNDNEQQLNMGALQDLQIVVGVDANGNQILATINVNPSMSADGANASTRFLSRFDNPADMHFGYLSDAEKRLIAEWLDVGAQYYNNPFDVPIN